MVIVLIIIFFVFLLSFTLFLSLFTFLLGNPFFLGLLLPFCLGRWVSGYFGWVDLDNLYTLFRLLFFKFHRWWVNSILLIDIWVFFFRRWKENNFCLLRSMVALFILCINRRYIFRTLFCLPWLSTTPFNKLPFFWRILPKLFSFCIYDCNRGRGLLELWCIIMFHQIKYILVVFIILDKFFMLRTQDMIEIVVETYFADLTSIVPFSGPWKTNLSLFFVVHPSVVFCQLLTWVALKSFPI